VLETNRIPFLDLVTPHRELKDELTAVFEHALETAGFVGGAMVEDFEKSFAKFCDAQHCVGVGSGTDALRFALIGGGVGHDDAVITVPNTFIATAEAISQCGALPRFVDVDDCTHNMDVNRLAAYLADKCFRDNSDGKVVDKQTGKRVKAVVPVHLYGQMADMDPILELAAKYHLMVIEDACQAHGAEYFSRRDKRWKKAGSMGRAAAFSFYPAKNLGACGEAGAVTTNDAELARKVRMLRDHGQAQKYCHDMEGYNGRLDAIQAGILRIKLRHLTAWNERRRECAARFQELFGSAHKGIKLPYEPSWAKAVFHLYVVRVQNRDQLQKCLAEAGIGTGIHYPIPLHLQKAYADLGYKKGDFPVSEAAAAEILSLPMYPGLGFDQQIRVAQQVLNLVSQGLAPVSALSSQPGSAA
jgi:dTDP-4-amino-4,6-dideoxygalactose transaminase